MSLPMNPDLDSRPIGVFDSGFGGLTVAREIIRQLPAERLLYFGDTLRCPYGPRTLDEVEGFAVEIAAWLAGQGVKMIVIACNTATAAALELVQRISPVPVLGVIEPGARAAVAATKNRIVGVIGTQATIESGAYSATIRRLDPRITVFSAPAPRFVDIIEAGLRLDRNPLESLVAPVSSVYIRPAFQEIARDYLNPLRRSGIDTLVLGCTHYPLITPLISSMLGPEVGIISSAEETAYDVASALAGQAQPPRPATPQPSAAPLPPTPATPQPPQPTPAPSHRFVTTGDDLEDFQRLGSAILGQRIADVERVSLSELEAWAHPQAAWPAAVGEAG